MSIITIYAECWVGCDDPDCPYTHCHSYDVREEDTGRVAGPFYTLSAAQEHDRKHLVDAGL